MLATRFASAAVAILTLGVAPIAHAEDESSPSGSEALADDAGAEAEAEASPEDAAEPADAEPEEAEAPAAPAEPAPAPPPPPPPPAPTAEPPQANPVPKEPPRARVLRIAVVDLEVDDIEPRVANVVADSLVTELRKLEGVSVVGMREIRAMLSLEAEKQTLGCDDDSCLAEIADALGVDLLVAGNLAAIADETVMGLRRIDQRAARVTHTFNQRLVPAGGEEFLAAIGPGVEKIFPELPLRPGEERGVSGELALRLNPPPLPVWSFGLAAAGSGVVLAVAGAALAVNLGAASEYWTTIDAASAPNGAFARYADLERLSLIADAALVTAVVVGAVGVAGGAVTAGMTPFVDWDDRRQVSE
jgi:hypothetical protein